MQTEHKAAGAVLIAGAVVAALILSEQAERAPGRDWRDLWIALFFLLGAGLTFYFVRRFRLRQEADAAQARLEEQRRGPGGGTPGGTRPY